MSFWKVTKQSIKEINPILGADFVEVATVLGWKCVVKKGECTVGSEGIYFPIDSQMPMDDERYAFLDRSSKIRRVKTGKFKKQISQGLFLSMTFFVGEEIQRVEERIMKEGVEVDLSDIFRVVHYEPPIPVHIGGDVVGATPEFIRKTDQERIQNDLTFLDLMKHHSMEVTEKLDGTSIQYFLNEGDFGVCSRNYRLKETETNTPWKLAKSLDIEAKLRKLNRNISIQGELVGPSIQGNKYKLNEVKYFVFDIWDIDKQRFIIPLARRMMVEELGLLHAPVIALLGLCSSKRSEMLMDEVIEMSKGKSMIGCNPTREGLVFKCCVVIDNNVPSFKVINNDYLLEEERK